MGSDLPEQIAHAPVPVDEWVNALKLAVEIRRREAVVEERFGPRTHRARYERVLQSVVSRPKDDWLMSETARVSRIRESAEFQH